MITKTSISPAEEAKIPSHVEKWCKKFTTPMPSEEGAKAAAIALSAFCGYPNIKVVVCKSPSEAKRLAREAGLDVESSPPWSSYGNASDYGWVSYYDFFQTECGVEMPKDFDLIRNYLNAGICESIQTDEIWWVVKNPILAKYDANDNLHCEDGPAIEFEDGDKYYSWHGTNVPEKWIMDSMSITREDVMGTGNLEARRAASEIIGNERLVEILNVLIVDEDVDNQGFKMHLLRSRDPHPALTSELEEDFRYLWFYQCVCPSTDRKYLIKVSPRSPSGKRVTTVWAAKASTFRREEEYFKPTLET